ncbi:hypothetical protein MKZ38_003331 [Zalerion maritima]|uniref:Uncharacterized protein n=1 Tax=Zalerion maritima TaxID=339359 RepID=A0AAD5RPD2_9PEZI|nr:hypothetical protein MKZ38_003331 [Zalerion maritima]
MVSTNSKHCLKLPANQSISHPIPSLLHTLPTTPFPLNIDTGNPLPTHKEIITMAGRRIDVRDYPKANIPGQFPCHDEDPWIQQLKKNVAKVKNELSDLEMELEDSPNSPDIPKKINIKKKEQEYHIAHLDLEAARASQSEVKERLKLLERDFEAAKKGWAPPEAPKKATQALDKKRTEK